MSTTQAAQPRKRVRKMVNLTLDPKIRKTGERLARQDGRSLSGLVERLILSAAAKPAA